MGGGFLGAFGLAEPGGLARLLEELLVSAEATGELVLLRTPPGAAPLLGSAIDKAGKMPDFDPDVLSSLAGHVRDMAPEDAEIVRPDEGELAVLLPDRQYNWLMRYERFGMLIIMALVCFGALSNVLDTAIGWVFQLFCRIVGFY